MDGPVISNWKSLVTFLGDLFLFFFIIEISGYFWDFVNHSENFRKPEDHSVHTNTIQYKVLFLMLLKVLMYSNLILGKWFVIKRSLPRSGAYDLERFCLFADEIYFCISSP